MADPPSSNPEKGVKFLAGTPDIVPSQPAHLNAPAIRPSPPVHADSTDSLHPGLKPEITAVPVTPGLELGGYEPISGTPRPSSGYFPSASPTEIENSPASKDTAPKVSSEAGASRTANASAEVPRGSSMSEIDQVSANPSLGLSGGVISATFCIPYSLEYQKSANWVRRRSRSLFTCNMLMCCRSSMIGGAPRRSLILSTIWRPNGITLWWAGPGRSRPQKISPHR